MQTAFRTSQGWTGTADYSLSKFVPHPKGNLGTEKEGYFCHREAQCFSDR